MRCVLVQLVGGLHPVADLEFGQDGLDVMAHGFGTEVQRRGDGSVTVAGGQQVGDLSLTPGEAVRIDLAVASAAASCRSTKFGKSLLRTTGRRPRTEPTEGGRRRLHGDEVTAELRQRGIVRTAEALPLSSGGTPISVGFHLVGSRRVMCNYFNAAANTPLAKSTAINSAF